MCYVVYSDHMWCEEHAVMRTDGWECKETGVDIQATIISRSLHDGSFSASGGGKVIKVVHLHCPKCNPDWKGPISGTPIKPDQIRTLT